MAQPPSPPSSEPNTPHYSPRLRATAVLVVVVCLFAALFGRLWYLQGVEANTVAVKSVAGQGIETVYIPAPRGEIFDRNGVLLAGNKIEQVVTVAPGAEAAHPGIVGELSAVLGESTDEVKAAIDNVQYSPYQSVPVDEGVSNAVVLAIDENQSLLPGVSVQAEPVRYYPQGETTANIVGYVSTITGPEYDQVKNEQCGPGVLCYQTTSLIGQAGVESSFEDYLRGTPGVEKVQVDSQGQVLGLLSYRPPVPGDNLVLSISLNDQRAAVQALNDWVLKARGMRDTVSGQDFRAPGASMVVEDPRNGQVLALATYPDYNPSDFLGGISEAKWKYYNNPSNNFPLIDRAISTGYAPGSTWKMITATAMMRYGLRSPYAYYDDTGSYSIGGQKFHDDDNVPLGSVDLAEALTQSSDTYFYSLGGQFWQSYDAGHLLKGPDPLQTVASQYGLGHYSGHRPSGRKPGHRPRRPGRGQRARAVPQGLPRRRLGAGVRGPGSHRRGPGLGDPATARQRVRGVRQWRGPLCPGHRSSGRGAGPGRPAERKTPQGVPPAGEEPRGRPDRVITVRQWSRASKASPATSSAPHITRSPASRWPSTR